MGQYKAEPRIGGGSSAADNALQYTSSDVSQYNRYMVEAITTAVDVEVSIDGTNWTTDAVFVQTLGAATSATWVNAIPAGDIGIVHGCFSKIRVRQAAAGGASSCRVMHYSE